MPTKGINAKPPIYKWKNKKLNAGYVTTFNNHAIVSENRITKIRNSQKDLDMLLLGCTASTAIGSVEKLCKINKHKDMTPRPHNFQRRSYDRHTGNPRDN